MGRHVVKQHEDRLGGVDAPHRLNRQPGQSVRISPLRVSTTSLPRPHFKELVKPLAGVSCYRVVGVGREGKRAIAESTQILGQGRHLVAEPMPCSRGPVSTNGIPEIRLGIEQEVFGHSENA